jgi:hypothetical protein
MFPENAPHLIPTNFRTAPAVSDTDQTHREMRRERERERERDGQRRRDRET